MPLLPPPQFVEHPADVVVDVFGTFLGKRSERMVIRWRVPDSPRPATETHPATERGPDSETSPDSAPLPDFTKTDVDRPVSREAIRSASSASPPETPISEPVTPADAAVAQLRALWAAETEGEPHPHPAPSMFPGQLRSFAVENSGALRSEYQEQLVPLSRLRSVTVTGRGVTVSSDLIAALVERGIGLSFLTGRGQPVAQVSSSGLGGTVQTRRSQLAAYTTSMGVQFAVEFIRGKLRNQKHQLQYSGKYLKSCDADRYDRLTRKVASMANLRKQLKDFSADSLDDCRERLMGYEGTGARIYWEGFKLLMEGRFEFPGRETRGAVDPINSALNYRYGILYGQVSAAVVNAGLELYAGFLHVDRPGKPALVLDLVEEFRAPVVDRVVLALVNQGVPLETDPHGLTAASRRLVADRVLERLATPVPYEGKRWPLGTIIQNQARHLAVAVRGERVYRAFASRW